MGLFGFGAKKPVNPPEYYLAQHSGKPLRQWALDSFKIMYFDTTSDKLYISDKIYLKYSYDNFWLEQDANAEPMPKAFKKSDEELHAKDLLELATEKGDPEAPFCLAMFNMIGIDFDNSRNPDTYRPDAAKTEAYLALARERGSQMEQAYQYIRKKVSDLIGNDLAYTELDKIAFEMFTAYDFGQKGKRDEALGEILGDLLNPFSKLGLLMMAACSNMKLPKCTVSMACNFINLMRDEDERNALTSRVVAPVLRADEEKCYRAETMLLHRLVVQAQNGDNAAATALQHFKINVGNVLSSYEKLRNL